MPRRPFLFCSCKTAAQKTGVHFLVGQNVLACLLNQCLGFCGCQVVSFDLPTNWGRLLLQHVACSSRPRKEYRKVWLVWGLFRYYLEFRVG